MNYEPIILFLNNFLSASVVTRITHNNKGGEDDVMMLQVRGNINDVKMTCTDPSRHVITRKNDVRV